MKNKQQKYPFFYKDGRVELYEVGNLFFVNKKDKRFELRTIVFQEDQNIRELFVYIEI